jgi:CDP-paratose 2-epimerase
MMRHYREEPRKGDHRWWISDTRKFEAHYPEWRRRHGIRETLVQIHDELARRARSRREPAFAR